MRLRLIMLIVPTLMTTLWSGFGPASALIQVGTVDVSVGEAMMIP